MAITVGGVAIDLSADAAQIVSEMAKAGKAVSKAASDMERQSGGRFARFFSNIERHASRSANSVKRSFGTLSRTLSRFALPAFEAVLGGGLASLISGGALQKVISDLDALAKQADKVGVTVEALQKFRFAAEQSGVGMAQADVALQRFSRRIGEAAQGGGELKDILDQYNIAVRDSEGRTRAVSDVLADYADVLAGAESSQEQLRLAFKAFDTEGAALVNLLRDGSAGMKEFSRQVEVAGVVTDEQARAAERASDALGLVGFTLKQRLIVAVADAIPSVESLANKFYEAIPAIGNFVTKSIRFFDEFVDEFHDRVETTKRELNVLIRGYNAVAEFVGGETLGEFEIAGPDLQEQLDALDAKLAQLRSSAGDFSAEIAAGEAQRQKLIDQIQLAEAGAAVFTSRLTAAKAAVVDLSGASAQFEPPALPPPPSARPPADILALPRLSEVIGPEPPPPFPGGPPAPALPKPRFVTNPPLPPPEKPVPPEVEAQLARAEDATNRFGQTFENVFTSILDPTKNFTDTLKDLPNILANLIIQMTIIEPIARALAASLSNVLFSPAGAGTGLFGGLLSFQHGGIYPAGRLALVGEAGPELFASRSGGRVLDARMTRDILSGGGGGTTNVNIDARNAQPGVKAEVFNGLQAAMPLIKGDIAEDNSRRRGHQGASR